MVTDQGEIFSWQQLASGITAVWAHENTRASLFDAMDRKEIYAYDRPPHPGAILRWLELHRRRHQQPGTG